MNSAPQDDKPRDPEEEKLAIAKEREEQGLY